MIATPKELHVILGKKPWKVWKGFGSFLLFEFGTKHKDPNGNIYGSHTLWVYMASWRIRRGSNELAHSESTDAKIERAAAKLSGQKLEAISLETGVVPRCVSYGARLFFEGGYRVIISMYERAKRDDTIFMLYTPRTVISFESDGTLQSERLKYRRA